MKRCIFIVLILFGLAWPTRADESPWIDLSSTLTPWKGKTAGWIFADKVELDPKNPKKLVAALGKTILVNGPGRASNLISQELWGDLEVHVEFLIAKGSNSGVKLHGHYEIQIIDSHGLTRPLTGGDCGGVYPRAELKPKYHHIDKGIPPSKNAARPAGEWQSLDIIFLAPRFDDAGKKTANARFLKVVLNGTLIHDNVELLTPTGNLWRNPEMVKGPLFLQGDHGPTAFRNVRVRPWTGKEKKSASVSLPMQEIKQRLDKDYPHLDLVYKQIHANPELAFQEEHTAARLARELKNVGFEVTEKVGITGVVGVLKNGKGPTVLVRADMDALPIVEQTGLDYASKVRMRDKDGLDIGVMHACGHDVNVTSLIGTARMLAGMKDRWQGTLVFIGQPAEEIGQGAKKMLDDGLFKRFPRPDYALALHCDARFPHGTITYREGQLQAHVDSMDILVRGKGGHGAAPHTTIDPVVIAARLILDLQTISSRERDPLNPVVVTVGSIHGGTKHNIIPSEVKLQLTIRTLNDATRKDVLESIVRLAKAASQAARAPEPIITHDPGTYTPALVKDAALTKRMVGLFQNVLGADKVIERPMSLGGEDFSHFGRAGVQSFYYFLGSVSPEAYAESRRPGGKALAPTHGPYYFPVPEPTIKTGVTTMTAAVLHLVGK